MRESSHAAARPRRGLALTGAVAERSIDRFFADGCPKLAAAISFYSLFALFPLAILAVAAFGIVVNDAAARSRVIDTILQAVPLREGSGRDDLSSVLESVTAGAGVSGVVGAVGLILSASGVMGAVRFALNHVWGLQDDRPPLRGKALDVALVLAAGAVLAAALGGGVLVRSVRALDGLPEVLIGELLPVVLAFGVYLALLRVLPATRPQLRDLWPGALLGAAGYGVAKFGFALYLDRLSDLGAVYASLATVVAFLLFVWVSANLFLLGAEVAAHLGHLRLQPVVPGHGQPALRRVGALLRGLVLRPRDRAEGAPRP
jgi:membrane protein